MIRLRSFPRGCLAVFLGAYLVAGCGHKMSVGTVPVSGKVTVGDEPVTAGQVSFMPATDTGTADVSAGQIESTGEYKIFTGGKEGAPVGKYKVTVTPSMVPTGGNKAPTTSYNAKYTNPRSTDLFIEVVSSPSPGAYDLKLKK